MHREVNREVEDAAALAEIDEVQGRHASLWRCRLLVVAFSASVLTCLAALWFSGTLLSAPDGLLSVPFLSFIAAHRLLVLSAPAVILVVCYIGLRRLTGEIMIVPERYLDERQKMVRDQAHRSAFKLVKLACLLIPSGFLLPHLPWFNHPTPATQAFTLHSVLNPIRVLTLQSMSPNAASWVDTMHQNLQSHTIQVVPLVTVVWSPDQVIPPIMPATTMEIALAGGLLLLCLLLMASALPMAVLAWKGKI